MTTNNNKKFILRKCSFWSKSSPNVEYFRPMRNVEIEDDSISCQDGCKKYPQGRNALKSKDHWRTG